LLLSVATIPLLQNNHTFSFTKFATASTHFSLLLPVNTIKKYASKILTYKSTKNGRLFAILYNFLNKNSVWNRLQYL